MISRRKAKQAEVIEGMVFNRGVSTGCFPTSAEDAATFIINVLRNVLIALCWVTPQHNRIVGVEE